MRGAAAAASGRSSRHPSRPGSRAAAAAAAAALAAHAPLPTHGRPCSAPGNSRGTSGPAGAVATAVQNGETPSGLLLQRHGSQRLHADLSSSRQAAAVATPFRQHQQYQQQLQLLEQQPSYQQQQCQQLYGGSSGAELQLQNGGASLYGEPSAAASLGGCSMASHGNRRVQRASPHANQQCFASCCSTAPSSVCT
jgi:hypothetical protein